MAFSSAWVSTMYMTRAESEGEEESSDDEFHDDRCPVRSGC